MVLLFVGAALLTPIGWVRSQPVYTLRIGIPAHLGPRPEDRDLKARFERRRDAAGPPGRQAAFVARRQRYEAIPPGLSVEAATGALVGIPTMTGTYTLAMGVTDGAPEPLVVGPSFKVRVLPAETLPAF